MEALGTDIFHCGGKDWLVVVDRYSGFPIVRQLHSMASSAVIRRLDAIFWEFGLPNRVRSDGGPQFASSEFRDFLTALDITHEISSPYNPASNGLAEAGVKQVKHLMIKCSAEGTNYDRVLHACRCTQRADGFSPFQMFFGRAGKSLLPALQAALYPTETTAASAARRRATERWVAACADRRRKCIYHPGDLVFAQDPISGTWTKEKVQKANGTGSYIVEFEDGACKFRNEKYLRLQKCARAPESVKSDSPPTDHAHITRPNSPSISVPPDPISPRRSPRLAQSTLLLASSLSAPTMIGLAFSPYVSTIRDASDSITHHYNCSPPLYSTILMRQRPTQRLSPPPTWPPQLPTRPPTAPTAYLYFFQVKML